MADVGSHSDNLETIASCERRQVSIAAFAWIVLAAAHLPLLWILAKRLWSTEHYQFFPLILVGSLFLTYQCWPTKLVIFSGRTSWRVVGAIMTLVVMALAALTRSPWLMGVSALTAMVVALYFWGGSRLLRALFPAWAFLWLAIPLPLGLDRQLILSLQHTATTWASQWLDLYGLRHAVSGVEIQLPARLYFVEEACSGIHSLFAAVSCGVFYSILLRRHFVRGLFVVGAAMYWVFIANVLRVTLVTVLNSKWDLPIAEGLGHDLVGVAVFLLAVGLTISSDRLLLFFFPGGFRPGPAIRRWSKQIFLRRRRNKRRQRGGSEVVARRSKKQSLPKEASHQARPATTTETVPETTKTKTLGRLGAWEGSLIAVAASLLIVLQLFTVDLIANQDPAMPPFLEYINLGEDCFPASWNRWQRVEFVNTVRDDGDPNGQHSGVWQYEQGGLRCMVSIDGPFVGWHNLANCLEGQGWEIEHQENIKYTEVDEDIPGGFSELQIGKGLDRDAVVLFAVFDHQHRPVMPPDTYVGFRAVRRFPNVSRIFKAIFGGAEDGLAEDSSGTYQIQLFLDSSTGLTEPQVEELRSFFHMIRRTVTQCGD